MVGVMLAPLTPRRRGGIGILQLGIRISFKAVKFVCHVWRSQGAYVTFLILILLKFSPPQTCAFRDDHPTLCFPHWHWRLSKEETRQRFSLRLIFK